MVVIEFMGSLCALRAVVEGGHIYISVAFFASSNMATDETVLPHHAATDRAWRGRGKDGPNVGSAGLWRKCR